MADYIDKNNVVFVDVDTQFDFMLPGGKLYVKDAEKLIPNIKGLIEFAAANHIPILSSMDIHVKNDEEFKEFPPHCAIGTTGYEKIQQTLIIKNMIIENRPTQIKSIKDGQIIIEKDSYRHGLFGNVNIDAILNALDRKIFIVFGVATEYCVKGAAMGLVDRGMKVYLVEDAVKPMSQKDGQRAIAEIKGRGVLLVDTNFIVKNIK